MSKQEEAGLILKLYGLRREETMRKARDWYFREFNPQSLADFQAALFSEHDGYCAWSSPIGTWPRRLSTTINLDLFCDSDTEHIGVFAKIEPLLGEIREVLGAQFAASFEKLIDAMPDSRKRVAQARERMKAIRAQMAQKRQAKTA
jgi:hypothetical protein